MQIQKLTHCNVYLAGVSYVGQFSEVSVPEVKHKAQEHKAGDMIGTRRISGPLEAMECTLKADGFYENFHGVASNPDTELMLQVRANLKTYAGGMAQDVPVSMDLVGWCSNNKVGTLQAQDYAKPEYKIEVHYFCLRVNGVEIQAIDVDNHIHRVNGEDLLAQFRSNLGID
jgi:P2 family phage contractile tail tube protein